MTKVMEAVLQRACQQPEKDRWWDSLFNNRELDQRERAGDKYKTGLFDLNIWWNLNILRDTCGEVDSLTAGMGMRTARKARGKEASFRSGP